MVLTDLDKSFSYSNGKAQSGHVISRRVLKYHHYHYHHHQHNYHQSYSSTQIIRTSWSWIASLLYSSTESCTHNWQVLRDTVPGKARILSSRFLSLLVILFLSSTVVRNDPLRQKGQGTRPWRTRSCLALMLTFTAVRNYYGSSGTVENKTALWYAASDRSWQTRKSGHQDIVTVQYCAVSGSTQGQQEIRILVGSNKLLNSDTQRPELTRNHLCDSNILTIINLSGY